ncbi:MAG: oxidoreductase [Ignavibacteria bacterium]|nr:oxidoreductase [Ignavibacteria bacterium]
MGTRDLDRRTFLRTTLLGGSSALLASATLPDIARSTARASTFESPIIRRKLGKTGIELPIVSFGVMRADNPALVHEALKLGIVHFDTAHGYQRGRNEEMLGEVFKNYPRDSFVIGTKVHPEEIDRKTGIPGPATTSKAFLERLDTSLKRLRLEYVDILYVHELSRRDAVLHPELLEALTLAKKAGKARHIGFSTHRNEPEAILAAIDGGVHEVVLSSINFKQAHYAEVKHAVEKAAQAGIGIIAMKTMAGAFHDREKTKPINCKAALKFVLQDENVTTAIPGITNFDHLTVNASVNTDLTMTNQELEDLALGQTQGGLYCQGCEHCIPGCPKGLPIPDIMRAYMYTYGYNDPESARTLLTSLDVPDNVCAGCSTCTAVCSKGFAISERVTDVMRLTKVPAEFIT